jgi:hypothetical protein
LWICGKPWDEVLRIPGVRSTSPLGVHRIEGELKYLIIFPIVFIYTAILWVAVLVVYNLLFEPFDFGALSWFAVKSVILVGVVSLVVTFVPLGLGRLASLPFWWIGLVVTFKKDVWECRILVFLLWGVNFLVGWMFQGLLLLAWSPSD